MMNVFTDILYDASSITAPQITNHNALNSQSSIMTQQSYNVPQSKIMQHDLSMEQKSLHFHESVSQLSSFDRSLNHSSRPPEINLYGSTSQIHIPSNLDSTFEDQSNVSVFSDSFPEIVPSWLTHDFMKASENLPSPNILSNVNDIYSNNEPNHLEMLDLNFPPELTAHHIPDNLNPTCNGSNRKIMVELPMQRFHNNDSLLMNPFSINNPQFNISLDKSNLQPHDFKEPGTSLDHSQSLMNSLLPCDNNLLQLPLHSSIAEQCLTSSSPIISNTQSQSHVVCDKLPQISLNHLDTLLENDAALSDMQLLRHDFTDVCLTNGNNNLPVDVYNPNGNYFNNMLQPDLPRLPQSKDASVQVSSEVAASHISTCNLSCLACSNVEPEIPMDVVQCLKCKYCEFVSLHKCSIARHMKASHSKTVRLNNKESNKEPVSPLKLNQRSDSSTPRVIKPKTTTAQWCENHANNQEKSLTDLKTSPNQGNFSASNQYSNQDKIPQELANLTVLNNQKDVHSMPERKLEPAKLSDSKQNQIFPKVEKKAVKKSAQKKSNADKSSEKNEKNISSYKKAWQKKMTRELGSYICESKGCNVRFRAIDNLEYHRKCHGDGIRTFICPECGANFFNWGAMAGHLWHNHGNDMELHKCDQCPFRTFSLSRLENIHKKIHGDECLFLCDTCGMSFKNRKQLRSHIVKHTITKKSFKCSICDSSFTYQETLRRHVQNHHMKIKPFQCKYCDHAASTKHTLELHMRTHTGDRPFKCDECDYRSTDLSTLRTHKRKHSGCRRYQCPLCAYSCNQAFRFKEHLRKMHGDEHTGLLFSCNMCSFKSINKELYAQHMREHENTSQGENISAIPSGINLFPLTEESSTSLSPTDDASNFNDQKNIPSFRLISLEIDLMQSNRQQHIWKLQ